MAQISNLIASRLGQFMSGPAGRLVRVVAGVGVIAAGLAEARPGGYFVAAAGVVPLAAGALDRCVVTGLTERQWPGDIMPACAARAV